MSDSKASQASISLPLLGFTFTLAFCSIVYELLLGQILSAFLGNTVLRYSVTIGLYMFSMGIGALIASPALLRYPVLALQVIELILALLGSVSVLLLFLIDSTGSPPFVFSIIAHTLIIVIGILTGLEIPLLVELRADVENAPSRILGIDYIGAFVGTLAFALWFYPQLGIFITAFATALLNAIVGILLPIYLRGQARFNSALVVAQAVALIVLIIALTYNAQIEEFAIDLYINRS